MTDSTREKHWPLSIQALTVTGFVSCLWYGAAIVSTQSDQIVDLDGALFAVGVGQEFVHACPCAPVRKMRRRSRADELTHEISELPFCFLGLWLLVVAFYFSPHLLSPCDYYPPCYPLFPIMPEPQLLLVVAWLLVVQCPAR